MGWPAVQAGAAQGDGRIGRSGSSFCTASSAPIKPILLWVPSQNGFITDPPHRHRETLGKPSGVVFLFSSGIGTGCPSASTRLKSPITQYGPFFRTRIVTSAIGDSRKIGDCSARG